MKQTIEMASAAFKNEEGIVGVPTGLRDLDDKLGGLHQSDLIIIAGRPSMGKTSLATNIAFNAAQKLQESGKKSSIAFFSLEMSSEQLSTRIISEQARISSNDIRRGRISDDQFDKFLETSKIFLNCLFILMKLQQLVLLLWVIEQDVLKDFLVWIWL